MHWTQHLDGYCERTDPSFWSEPLNALTNFLYLAGALYMYARSRGDQTAIARLLSVMLGLIAIGSFLFHTFATPWAALTDVIPIGLFILIYLFAVNRMGWMAPAPRASQCAIMQLSSTARKGATQCKLQQSA